MLRVSFSTGTGYSGPVRYCGNVRGTSRPAERRNRIGEAKESKQRSGVEKNLERAWRRGTRSGGAGVFFRGWRLCLDVFVERGMVFSLPPGPVLGVVILLSRVQYSSKPGQSQTGSTAATAWMDCASVRASMRAREPPTCVPKMASWDGRRWALIQSNPASVSWTGVGYL